MARTRREGIVVLHRPGCTREWDDDAKLTAEAKCPCRPRLQAAVWLPTDKKRLRKNFSTLAEAKGWLVDARAAKRAGTMRAPATMTVAAASDELLKRMRRGAIRNRSGDKYKPSAVRNYEQGFRLRLVPALGPHRLSDVGRQDLQRLVGEWQAQGLDPSTIRNTINGARVLYRHADELTGGQTAGDPTIGLRLPAVRGRRDRIASPEEAQRLLDALPASDRAVWATAFFAGLQNGELRALRWEDVDLAGGVIHVQRGWDVYEAEIAPKSEAGNRRVPIIPRLRDLLLEHKIATDRATGLVFGRTETQPFSGSAVNDRAKRAWGWKLKPNPDPEARPKKLWVKAHDGALTPIGMHEARHTYASHMIAAGVSMSSIKVRMGHTSITTTVDLYGHLLPGSEAEDAGLLEAFLERADTASRIAQLDGA
jgi:integrase